MATLDYTGDGGTSARDPLSAPAKDVVYYRRLYVADIIAADATMTSNGYIAANDIIQAIDVPIGFVFRHAVIRIITACTTSVNVEVGLNGGAEYISSFDVDGTAGTCAQTTSTEAAHTAGVVFTAADTIDVQFITANCEEGELELWVFGKMLQVGTAS